MGLLPFARTITLNLGDPLPPPLVGEIQDQFVGDKHTNRPFFLPSVAFLNTGAGANAAYTGGIGGGGGVWSHNGAATMELQAPLVLPPGTSLDKIEVFFKRASGLLVGDLYNIRLISRTLTVGAAPAAEVVLSTQVLGNAANNYPNLDHLLLAGLPLVTAANTAYWIQWDTFMGSTVGGEVFDVFYGVGGSCSRP